MSMEGHEEAIWQEMLFKQGEMSSAPHGALYVLTVRSNMFQLSNSLSVLEESCFLCVFYNLKFLNPP